jgi:hypothetical protein
MDDHTAATVVDTIVELWPSPPMTDTARVFYAKALTVIPEPVEALRAVERLFVAERFRPPPGDVIDRALGLEARAQVEWDRLVAAANEQQARRPPPETSLKARQALAAVGYRLQTLPTGHLGALHKARGAFVERYGRMVREDAAAAALGDLGAAGAAGELNAGRPANNRSV